MPEINLNATARGTSDYTLRAPPVGYEPQFRASLERAASDGWIENNFNNLDFRWTNDVG